MRVLNASLGHLDRIEIGQTVVLVDIVGDPNETVDTLLPKGAASPEDADGTVYVFDEEASASATLLPDGMDKRWASETPSWTEGSTHEFNQLDYIGVAEPAEGWRDAPDSTGDGSSKVRPSTGPRTLGPYDLIREIGSGGMGTVYLAQHRETGDRDAVKLIQSYASDNEKACRIFLRETSVLTQLNHPRIVRALDFGLEDGVSYLVMEYIPTVDLAELISSQPNEDRIRIVTWTVFVVLQAVHYLHEQGIVHRDIKPSNVLSLREGRHLRSKLADFGLAKFYEDSGISQMTNLRSIRGTLANMAPEQLKNSRDAGPLVDLFACGTMLYEWLTGRRADMIRQPLQTLTLLDQDDSIPTGLKPVIAKSIQVDPAKRFQSALQFGEALYPFHQKRGVGIEE